MRFDRYACIVIISANSLTWSMLNPVRYAVLLFCPSVTRDVITAKGLAIIVSVSIAVDSISVCVLGIVSSAPRDTKNIAEKKSFSEPVVSSISMLCGYLETASPAAKLPIDSDIWKYSVRLRNPIKTVSDTSISSSLEFSVSWARMSMM